MQTHRPYPSIGTYRNTLAEMNYHKVSELEFYGTVKLHGSHSDIVIYSDGNISYQSRNRILSLESDNMGFVAAMSQLDLSNLIKQVRDTWLSASTIVLAGEWCGSNIQKGVALSKLPKMFVLFDIRVDERWVNLYDYPNIHDNSVGIYNIMQFPNYRMTVKVDEPEVAQEALVKLTNAVEAECPVGKYFGVYGTGEGVVWKPVDAQYNEGRFWFKVKGEAHSVTTVKQNKDIAPIEVQRMKDIQEFAERCASANRCEQGRQSIPYPNDMAAFLRWVCADVLKEEADTITVHGWKTKDVTKAINQVARHWFQKQV